MCSKLLDNFSPSESVSLYIFLPLAVSPPLPSKGETSVNLSVPIDSAIKGEKNSLKAPGFCLSPISAFKTIVPALS